MAGAKGSSRRDLHELAKQLAEWRRTHAVGARIPDWLWKWAAEVAGLHGVSRTATALKLNYSNLKRRVAEKAAAAPPRPECRPTDGFIELPPAPLAMPCQCKIEFEKPCGSRLRIELTSMPDLVALARGFWESA
ncbi:MAG TPA: hypothetical protein VFW87_26865 [Pirellulales bacterium]|nr:hypothetical protein [Pirellulales bacterium]